MLRITGRLKLRHRGAGPEAFRRRLGWAAAGMAIAALLAVGGSGAIRYVSTFWLYRGFPAPTLPRSVRVRGPGGTRQVPVTAPVVQSITVRSAALAGYPDRVDVVLPPGYAGHPWQRYPVLYLLHGFPGLPAQYLDVGQVADTEARLVASGRMNPLILVMPTGTRSYLTDEEWANGVRHGNGWETFVARTLVRTIDSRYRTIAAGNGRGIGGLSEGGYGALNIGLHHPGEFTLMESWSGYMVADPMPAVFGRNASVRRYNSPAARVPAVAARLRATHSYVWFYIAVRDHLARQNRAFAAELQALGVAHHYFQTAGRHTWALWRRYLPLALITASDHLSHG